MYARVCTPSRTPKTPLLENTCLFPLISFKQSDAEKISFTINIDKISLGIIKHQTHQVRKYKSRRNDTTLESGKVTFQSCVRVNSQKFF